MKKRGTIILLCISLAIIAFSLVEIIGWAHAISSTKVGVQDIHIIFLNESKSFRTAFGIFFPLFSLCLVSITYCVINLIRLHKLK